MHRAKILHEARERAKSLERSADRDTDLIIDQADKDSKISIGKLRLKSQQVDADVAASFHIVDRDHSGEIDVSELQTALVNGNWSRFNKQACRMMIGKYARLRLSLFTLISTR